jgi:phosphoribosylformimino-5-aminoimidazole carboxamide ribotide isomerase
MQVIPAIDLRDGACVQLVGGSYAEERVRIQNPQAVFENWVRLGFSRVHLVDLDAATGRGSNRAIVDAILRTEGVEVQCGGGIRDLDTIGELFDAGASEVVLGTRAVEDMAWLEDAIARYPSRIIVAADTKGRRLVTRGWSTDAGNVIDFVDYLSTLPLAAILVTAVDKEGRMEGPDLSLMQEILVRSDLPLQASGGIRDIDDIRALAGLGVSAAIVGMALYTGALNPQTVIEEFV